MENVSKPHLERESSNSPTSNNGATHSVTSSNSNNGVQIPTPPLTPKPNHLRSESNPYPTTVVQADTSNFKQVVQMLTGSSSESTKSANPKPLLQDHPIPSSKNFSIPPIKTVPKKQQSFKLYERRNNLKNSPMINTLLPNFVHNSGFSPRNRDILSPRLLDFPSLTLSSPVTPLNDDPFDKSSPSLGNSSEEEKAIAQKGFYLHPSPKTTPTDSEPQLLSLFPVTSPRVSGSSS